MSEIQQRELEIQNAKAQLLQSSDGEQSTYDILAKTIRIMLDERPANPADVLSPIIDRVKRETVVGTNNISGLQTSNEPSNNKIGESIGESYNNEPPNDEIGESIEESLPKEEQSHQPEEVTEIYDQFEMENDCDYKFERIVDYRFEKGIYY